MSENIIKCDKCGHVLISGSGAACLFGSGASIGCLKCGNKYVFEKTKCVGVDAKDKKITFEV